MENNSALATGQRAAITALSICPKKEDHAGLRSLISTSDWPLCRGFRWALRSTDSLDKALPVLVSGGIPVLLCERDLARGTWKDVVEALHALPDPPYVIVTSKHADDRLWVEALNLGAYDVLQTPFNPSELTRTLSLAWLRWTDRRKPMVAQAARSVA